MGIIKFILKTLKVKSSSKSYNVKQQEKIFSDAKRPIHIEFQERIESGGWGVSDKGISRYGFPQRSAEANHFRDHSLCYNFEKRIPHWVFELLTSTNINGKKVDKSSAYGFQPDPNQPVLFSTRSGDYRNSGWSRGHMAAAANHNFLQKALTDTFYYSNIVPQDKDNNNGFWNRLEMYSRNLIKKYDRLYVVTGPLFVAVQEGSKKYVKYEVIGKSQIAVPTHLFKVLLAEDNKQSLLACFIIPNKPISCKKMGTEYQVELEEVEIKSGLVMFPDLDRLKVGRLCDVEGCVLPQDYELSLITSRVQLAHNLRDLEFIYSELYGREPDQLLIDVYRAKKAQLEAKMAKKITVPSATASVPPASASAPPASASAPSASASASASVPSVNASDTSVSVSDPPVTSGP